MDKMNRIIVMLGILLLAAIPVVAEENFAGSKVSSLSISPKEAGNSFGSGGGKTGAEDEQLAIRLVDFERFAKGKIQDFNRNHILAPSRMQIRKQPDGLFRGVFHQIDGASLAYKVSRSQSRGIPFVGVLSYQEQVFEGFGATPEECRQSQFSPVAVIPNRHIFSYSNGAWN